MRFYSQVLDNLDNNIQPKNRIYMLQAHMMRHFPILYQRYPLQVKEYISGKITYAQFLVYLTEYKSQRILQIEHGKTRSKSHIFGGGDPVLSEIRRFQEAFGLRKELPDSYVPGTLHTTGIIKNRVKTFLW